MLNCRLFGAVLAAIVLVLSGCASSTPGELKCDTDEDCPAGRACDMEAGVCVRAQIETNNENNIRPPESDASVSNIPRQNNDEPDMGGGSDDMGGGTADMGGNNQPACSPACGANEECSNGECVLACDPACEGRAVCTENGCEIPDCTAAGQECDVSRAEQGDFTCIDVDEPTGICLATCTNLFTADDCADEEYCWDYEGAPVCLPALCETNADCDGGTCTSWDNNFSICLQNGTLPDGASCDPSAANGCAVGHVCRETGATTGVCSAICDPFAASPGCGADEYCGEPFTTREWLCSDDLDSTAPNDPWVQCFDPGAVCDDATRCLSFGSTSGCMKFCRPGSADCSGVSAGSGPTICNEFSFPGQRAVGLCDLRCTGDSDCGATADCVNEQCRLPCSAATVTDDCCGGNTPCNWTCEAGYCS